MGSAPSGPRLHYFFNNGELLGHSPIHIHPQPNIFEIVAKETHQTCYGNSPCNVLVHIF